MADIGKPGDRLVEAFSNLDVTVAIEDDERITIHLDGRSARSP
jgi:hypothetical protein